ncbi:MAG: hypothetical protein J7497_05845, partial [Chitinophagaceae bacterium]|nr:hypothetical protein [Chitinophagaceae bacterium]
FKDAEIETSNYSPAYLDKTETSSAYIIIGHSVRPSQAELNAILNHIYSGNKVFISSFNIGQNLLDSFGLATA